MPAAELLSFLKQTRESGPGRKGDLVSGTKPARFTRRSVEQALNELRGRIQAGNEDPNADYKITDVVAFGDFLGDAARVQAAEVGIRLTARGPEQFTGSAKEHRAELSFLKGLRGKTALLKLVQYEKKTRHDCIAWSDFVDGHAEEFSGSRDAPN